MNEDKREDCSQLAKATPGDEYDSQPEYCPPGFPPIVQAVKSKTFTIGSGSKANILAGEVTVEDTDHQHKRLQGNMYDIIQKDSAVFVKTEAYPVVSACLGSQGHVTIKGEPGCGKSAMAYQLLRDYMNQGFDVLIIDDPSKLKHDRDPFKKTIILVDSIFGIGSFAPDSFVKCLENELCPLLQNRGEDKPDLKIVFTSQTKYLEEAIDCQTYLRQNLFSDNTVIDISCLTESDKRVIITNHQKRSRIKIEDDAVKEICKTKTPFGFPKTCHLFFRQTFCNNPLDFFEHPWKYL